MKSTKNLLLLLMTLFATISYSEKVPSEKKCVTSNPTMTGLDNIVPPGDVSIKYESSIACNVISTIELKRNGNNGVSYRRQTRIEDNKEIPSKLIVQNNIPYTTNPNNQVTINIPDDGTNYWFIPFDPSKDPVLCSPGGNVVVYDCSCNEAPADYVGSAYCALKVTFGSTNVWYCVHQACCNCKLNKTGSGVSNGEGIILQASSVSLY